MESLSKLIAAAGVASRRKAAEIVRSGRVRVDGVTVTEPGTRVDAASSMIEVDGHRLCVEQKRYLVLNKPRGPLSTVKDYRGRRTVLDVLPEMKERLYPAGRLDADTEGLLVLTNDGDLTYRLTHPRFGVEKVYEAEVVGALSRKDISILEDGMMLEEGATGPATVRVLKEGDRTSSIEITVHAGRKRMVRRMLKAVGHPVVGLKRIRVGLLELGGLKPGEWRWLTDAEVEALKATTSETAPGKEGGCSRESSEAPNDG